MNAPAFLALWNGVQAGRHDEYEAWHSIEHMPERLGTPGFLAARRYRAADGDDYFTLYEMETLAALESPDYAALMHAPTAWSLRMRQVLTGFRRLPCQPVFHRRTGLGGALATLRLDLPAEPALAVLRPLLEEALQQGIIFGTVLGASDAASKPYPVFPNAPVPGVECLLLLEGSEAAGPLALAQRCAATLSRDTPPQSWRLLQDLRRNELSKPNLARQPARDDLLRRWFPDEGRT
jgi:hypothetical protein